MATLTDVCIEVVIPTAEHIVYEHDLNRVGSTEPFIMLTIGKTEIPPINVNNQQFWS